MNRRNESSPDQYGQEHHEQRHYGPSQHRRGQGQRMEGQHGPQHGPGLDGDQKHPGMQPQRRPHIVGPKCSDDQLREEISERFMQAGDIDSSDVTVQVLGGKVVLEGTVPEHHMKHGIEEMVDVAPGVQEVDNRIRVQGS
jgi:hypothetical protein